MNIAGVIPDARTPYPGLAYEIYVAGCYRGCKGCHNPEMQAFNYGNPLDIGALLDDLNVYRDWFDIVSFLGGDLLCHPNSEAMRLVAMVYAHYQGKEFWLFTGAEPEELPAWTKEFFDVIKCGRYVHELHQEGFPSSSNQKILRRGVDYAIPLG